MAAIKKRRRPTAHQAKKRTGAFHAFWSGSLGFGLVNVRVLVFPASRHTGVRLRMLSAAGSLVKRKFYCPREEKPLRDDEIVRGYELDDGSYIIVQDNELDALEPEKTQEIALKNFVRLSDVPPPLFERGYYLTPQKEAIKAYRLLAEVMERRKKAGIATFVMRDREYVVAIFARSGILCAATLRFGDELRDPSSVGLPKPVSPPPARVKAFEKAIDALSVRAIPAAELAGDDDEKLRAVIQKKAKAGRDVIQPETNKQEQEADGDEEGDEDLLETIRKSLRPRAGS
jgi:DNA end-binding protein Ku